MIQWVKRERAPQCGARSLLMSKKQRKKCMLQFMSIPFGVKKYKSFCSSVRPPFNA